MDFHISNNIQLPKDIHDLKTNYTLEKEEGGWTLTKNKLSSNIRNFFTSISKGFKESPTHLSKNKLIAIMEIAANPNEKHRAKEHLEIFKSEELFALSRSPKFQEFSHTMLDVEKDEKRLKWKTKLKRAATKLAVIGRGIAEMKRAGIEGKMLSPSYVIEASTKEHLYNPHDHLEEWQESHSNQNFDDWISIHYAHTNFEKVKYLKNDVERLPYKLEFLNGKSFRNNAPFDTTNESSEHSGKGFAIFVIDSKGQFYAGSHIRGRFHHSSFLGGGAIQGGGEIKTNPEGKIIEISNKSGHYKPSKIQILNTLNLLEKAGVDLSQVKFRELTKKGTLIYHSSKEYLDTKGTCHCNGYEIFDIEGDPDKEYLLTLTDKFLSKKDRLEQLNNAIEFLKSEFNSSSFKYKEILDSGQSIEYPIDVYLKTKGKAPPSKWEGGSLEFEDDQLKRIVLSSSSTATELLSFLLHLEKKELDLSRIEIIKEGVAVNAKIYFDQLLAEAGHKQPEKLEFELPQSLEGERL